MRRAKNVTSWFPVAYAAAMAVYPVVNAKLRGPRTRQRYLTPVMDIADAIAVALAKEFGRAPDVVGKAKIDTRGRRVAAKARAPAKWHSCQCGQWVHDTLAPCSVCKPKPVDPKSNQGF